MNKEKVEKDISAIIKSENGIKMLKSQIKSIFWLSDKKAIYRIDMKYDELMAANNISIPDLKYIRALMLDEIKLEVLKDHIFRKDCILNLNFSQAFYYVRLQGEYIRRFVKSES